MAKINDLFGYDSLAFFGRVNASISHELKNIMAIISETAGLLSDLSAMAQAGTPISADMITSSTESIIEEIQRGFTTIRQMNRFAHSVDTPVVSIDLMEILDLVRNLSEYLSFAGKTNLHGVPGGTPMAQTSPFILQAILYQAVVQTFQHTGPQASLDISVQAPDASTWRIRFDGFSVKEFETFPDARTERMAESIGVAIHWDRATDRLEIDVPVSAEGLGELATAPKA
ncbi:Histidine kinase A domain-containing protein [Desulfosarcina cetonica]|nr:Histidine kinase A domain-containing protein [Desulfosarcina cetonica]